MSGLGNSVGGGLVAADEGRPAGSGRLSALGRHVAGRMRQRHVGRSRRVGRKLYIYVIW